MRKLLALAVVLCFVGTGCTLAERQAIKDDAGAYVGAPEHPDGSIDKNEAGEPVFDGAPDYDPAEVAAKAGKDALDAAAKRDWAGLLFYVISGVIVIGGGYLKRKALGQVTKKVARKITGG